MLFFFIFSEESSYTVIMHQDQIDEWRGWMMMVILIYHYTGCFIFSSNFKKKYIFLTGASQSVPIYMHIRLCISMHLFLLGYTHFTYSWIKGRTGITRLIQVMRKNILGNFIFIKTDKLKHRLCVTF